MPSEICKIVHRGIPYEASIEDVPDKEHVIDYIKTFVPALAEGGEVVDIQVHDGITNYYVEHKGKSLGGVEEAIDHLVRGRAYASPAVRLAAVVDQMDLAQILRNRKAMQQAVTEAQQEQMRTQSIAEKLAGLMPEAAGSVPTGF